MKGSAFYGHGNTSPSPNKFLGGLLKKAKGGIMGKVLNPLSMLPGKAGEMAGKIGGGGLFVKEEEMKKAKKTETKKEELNEWGETPEQYKKRMIADGFRKPDKK